MHSLEATGGNAARIDAEKSCACSGVRFCAACSDPALRLAWGMRPPIAEPPCLSEADGVTGRARDGSEVHRFDGGRQAAPGCPGFSGLIVWRDFVTEAEAARLLDDVESRPFEPAQSGKGKQHFGPRVNFRKRRMRVRGFEGLPGWAHALERRVRERVAREPRVPGLTRALDAFVTTDAFVLRYEPARASNLDPHVDDTWAYGELILDLALEGDGCMTFLDGDPQAGVERPFVCVRAPLPARSMALLFGPARYDWWHGIRARDVRSRRTSITLRTLGSALRWTDEGREVSARAERVLEDGADALP